MATTSYFEKSVKDQDKEDAMYIEFGRSSFYAGVELSGGRIGTDSIYVNFEGKSVTLDEASAKEFVAAANRIGQYFGWT